MPMPYLTHPVEVIVHLRHIGHIVDEEVLTAAALHDVIEECGVSPSAIQKRFGSGVRALVEEVTRREPTAQERLGLTSDEVRDLRSFWLLEGVRRMTPAAMRIKLADRLSNLREAARTRSGSRLDRYHAQSRAILEIVPREVSPELWEAVRAQLEPIPSNC
jgi:(p)ppGpp synthase/HD superfamily hydrolase